MRSTNPTEVALLGWLSQAIRGMSKMSDANKEYVKEEIGKALDRQFSGNKREAFRLRMSNIGKAYCQLWYEKNKPEVAKPRSNHFIMRMVLGDIYEAVFKGVLKEIGIKFSDNERVELVLEDGTIVKGELDIAIDDEVVDDVKTASNWSYVNKFDSVDELLKEDPFGYIGQLVGYAQAKGAKVGGWWVSNTATGEVKYVSAEGVDVQAVMKQLNETNTKLKANVFERGYEPVAESFRKELTGNLMLGVACGFCDFKYDCWKGKIQTLPSIPSKAKSPKEVDYVHIEEKE